MRRETACDRQRVKPTAPFVLIVEAEPRDSEEARRPWRGVWIQHASAPRFWSSLGSFGIDSGFVQPYVPHFSV